MFVLKYKVPVRSKIAADQVDHAGMLTPIRHSLALEIVSDAHQNNAGYGECHE